METLPMKTLLFIPMFPLLGAIITYCFTNRSRRHHAQAGWLATVFSVLSFIMVLKAFNSLNAAEGTKALVFSAWEWFSVGSLSVEMALRFDRLAAVMSLVVTGVGSLIHLYAIGYMAEDAHRPRFFSYLNLFLFAMLLLVLGDNLLLMFVGWEGVGLCSYLLIGFWFREMENAKAGQKAFVVNRIGDAGFILGLFILIVTTGTVNFAELEQAAGGVQPWILGTAALLLFVGAIGKSAQIPLYVWLPDAMAGPTPVSALIHAATMVTAGVYLIARLSFIFLGAPQILTVVLVIGTLTAFFAASIALVQNDIKKVLAYSTVSQLGFMFMAMGVAAFSNGIYHVVTHAFFKACLFMGAGSVIIGCHHEQDMRQFGGLRKSMPITFMTYLCATLAISGIPFTSGFYSKDGILWTVFSSDGYASTLTIFGQPLTLICWGIGIFTALLTAFYMTRSLVMTFFGTYRGHAHPHESPWVVTAPLVILATLSLGFGYWCLKQHDALLGYLAAWTRPDIALGHEVLAAQPFYHLLEYVSAGVAIAGVLLAYFAYGVFPRIPGFVAKRLSGLHELMLNKWRIDELYDLLVVRPLSGMASFLFTSVDKSIIDGIVNGTGAFVEINGEVARQVHTGRLSLYALLMLGGLVFFISFWLLL